MKKIALILAGLFVLSGAAQAQPFAQTRVGVSFNLGQSGDRFTRVGVRRVIASNSPRVRGRRWVNNRRWRRDCDNNPPGRIGGRGTNWENPPGPRGGWGASPNRRWKRSRR